MDPEQYSSNITGSITHEYPRGDDRSGTNLGRLFGKSDELGIALPKEAIEHYQRAEDLKGLARQAMREEAPGIRELARELGTGQTTAKKAEAQLPTALAAQSLDLQKNLRRLYSHAAGVARDQARRALHQAGDKLLDGPRRLAEKALADSRNVDSQTTWAEAQAYAVLLRAMHLVPLAEGATEAEYTYNNPDLAAEYEAKTSEALTLPIIGQHCEDLGPGILSASQVVEAAKAYAQPQAGQEQEAAGSKVSVVWDTKPGSGGVREPVAIRRVRAPQV